MSKKKSLGHNPLAYSTRSHASFDFIAPQKEEQQDGEKEERVQKETASYYLESALVNKIKNIADKENKSYSAVVSEILKQNFRDDS